MSYLVRPNWDSVPEDHPMDGVPSEWEVTGEYLDAVMYAARMAVYVDAANSTVEVDVFDGGIRIATVGVLVKFPMKEVRWS